jgi:hypothetical protein
VLAAMHFGNTNGTYVETANQSAAGSGLNTDSGLALILRK